MDTFFFIILFIVIFCLCLKFKQYGVNLYKKSKRTIINLNKKIDLHFQENTNNSKILFKQTNLEQKYDKQDVLNHASDLDKFKMALNNEKVHHHGKNTQILQNNSAFNVNNLDIIQKNNLNNPINIMPESGNRNINVKSDIQKDKLNEIKKVSEQNNIGNIKNIDNNEYKTPNQASYKMKV